MRTHWCFYSKPLQFNSQTATLFTQSFNTTGARTHNPQSRAEHPMPLMPKSIALHMFMLHVHLPWTSHFTEGQVKPAHTCTSGKLPSHKRFPDDRQFSGNCSLSDKWFPDDCQFSGWCCLSDKLLQRYIHPCHNIKCWITYKFIIKLTFSQSKYIWYKHISYSEEKDWAWDHPYNVTCPSELDDWPII